MHKLLLLVLLYLVTISSGADPLRVGVLHFPPYYVLENQSTVKGGILVEMLALILKTAKVPYSISGYPAKRLYLGVGSGDINLWFGTIGVPEYEGKVLVSPMPLMSIILELYTLRDVKNTPKSLADLSNTSIITLRGYSYAGAIKVLEGTEKNLTIYPTNTHDSAFDMLLAKRAEYVLDYSQPAIEVIKRKNIENLNSITISTIPVYLIINKNTPEADKLMDKLMVAYSSLKRDKKL